MTHIHIRTIINPVVFIKDLEKNSKLSRQKWPETPCFNRNNYDLNKLHDELKHKQNKIIITC